MSCCIHVNLNITPLLLSLCKPSASLASQINAAFAKMTICSSGGILLYGFTASSSISDWSSCVSGPNNFLGLALSSDFLSNSLALFVINPSREIPIVHALLKCTRNPLTEGVHYGRLDCIVISILATTKFQPKILDVLHQVPA